MNQIAYQALLNTKRKFGVKTIPQDDDAFMVEARAEMTKLINGDVSR